MRILTHLQAIERKSILQRLTFIFLGSHGALIRFLQLKISELSKFSGTDFEIRVSSYSIDKKRKAPYYNKTW